MLGLDSVMCGFFGVCFVKPCRYTCKYVDTSNDIKNMCNVSKHNIISSFLKTLSLSSDIIYIYI